MGKRELPGGGSRVEKCVAALVVVVCSIREFAAPYAIENY
jgi:hypothetical protein